MRKLSILLMVVCLNFLFSKGQTRTIDTLKQGSLQENNDTLQLILFDRLGEAYGNVNYDSASFYSRKAALLALELNYPLHEAKNLLKLAVPQIIMGSSAGGLEMLKRVQVILEEPEGSRNVLPARYMKMLRIPNDLHSADRYRLYLMGQVYEVLALMYLFDTQKEKAKFYALKEKLIAETLPSLPLQITNCLLMGNLFLNEPDTALAYLNKGYQMAMQSGIKLMLGDICNYIAKAYHLKKEKEKELLFRRASLHHNLEQENLIFSGWSYLSLADFFKETPERDSTIFYCHKAIQIALSSHNPPMEFWSYAVLKDTYKAMNKSDSAFVYMERMIDARDRSALEQQSIQLQATEYNQLMRQKDLAAAQMQYRNKLRVYALIGGLFAAIFIAGLMWRNMRHKQKSFALVQQQKRETERAYEQLKATQQQLVQQEKMASLGELTAGIAHEIQNPLNFVNNFSAINTELLEELTQANKEGDLYEVASIAAALRENEEKIAQHGKRADAIIKSMLQHSRGAAGECQPTDINQLVEEHLRLAYHGYRAKDKGFNSEVSTSYDTAISKVNLVPQEIGRVLLNLFNNAFYAVQQKKEQYNDTFEPVVFVSTRKEGNHIIITVKDNGTGMPPKVAEKVFQPFFTTKPTGEGTGLGLSLSYDIITKGHGGELLVDTKEGEYTEFSIVLKTD